jgi:TatD DNase family protein
LIINPDALTSLSDFHTHQKDVENSIFNILPGDDIPNQYFSWGIHPWYLDENWEKELEKIESASSDPKLMAIGECGFDLIRGPEIELQKKAFTSQAALAQKLGLPLILHCVKGAHLLQEYLKKHPDSPTIIWHGFNQNPQLTKSLLAYPVYFSFGKAILKKDSNAQKWLIQCPIEKIFFETDNSQIPVSDIYQQACLLLSIPVTQLAKQVKDNWNKISTRKI